MAVVAGALEGWWLVSWVVVVVVVVVRAGEGIAVDSISLRRGPLGGLGLVSTWDGVRAVGGGDDDSTVMPTGV